MYKIWLFLLIAPLSAQTFTVGHPDDPCTGGTPFTVPSSGQTVRFGDFTCTFPVGFTANSVGAVYVQLDFTEPCQAQGDCGVLVNKAGQRIQHTFVNDMPAVWSYDIYAAGLPTSHRTVTSYVTMGLVNDTAIGQVTVKVQTVVRAGVLSGVVITPVNPSKTGIQCGLDLVCTNLDAGTTKIDIGPTVATQAKIRAGTVLICQDTGPVNALACSPTLPWDGYANGTVVQVVPANTNTGPATLSISSISPAPIKKSDGTTDLAPGDLVAGRQVALTFDGTVFRLPAVITFNGAAGGTIAQSTLNGISLFKLQGSSYLAVPATPQALAIPTCPATVPCWQVK